MELCLDFKSFCAALMTLSDSHFPPTISWWSSGSKFRDGRRWVILQFLFSLVAIREHIKMYLYLCNKDIVFDKFQHFFAFHCHVTRFIFNCSTIVQREFKCIVVRNSAYHNNLSGDADFKSTSIGKTVLCPNITSNGA